jgi:monovalent cation:proton antiporter-2 (CPA2) family protein
MTIDATALPTALPFARPLILLAAAIVAVPLFRRLGLGSVLGYLAAGALVGPAALGLIGDPHAIMDFAELGIVMFLFLIGLSLRPSRLWSLRHDIFGLGTAQIVTTAAAITGAALVLFDITWKGALVAGLGLSLSSTALVMQLIEDRSEAQTNHGRKAFAILLMQDLAIVPLLAVLPLLSPHPVTGAVHPLRSLAEVLAAVACVVLIGRYVLNPLFRTLASAGAREIMTGAALFVVVGAASLVSLAGLSMATGAFLAGVMLAESNFRNQLQVDIEPFRGLLLGLFFMSVGMSVDFAVIGLYWDQILIAVVGLVVVKVVVLHLVLRIAGTPREDAARIAALLAQGGEFGFVLYSAAVAAGVMPAVLGSALIAVVTLTMATTPLVVAVVPRLLVRKAKPPVDTDVQEMDAEVVLIGFGRFGQILSRVLAADGLEATIIDRNPARIRIAARLGLAIRYGDATRLDVLRAAGLGRAKLVAITTETPETTTRIVELIKTEFPLVRVFARSFDRAHALALIERNVDYQVRETYESALTFGREALRALDLDDGRIEQVLTEVRRRDADRLVVQSQEARPNRRPAGPAKTADAVGEAGEPSHFGNTRKITKETESTGIPVDARRIPSTRGRASLRIATRPQGDSP